MTIAFEIVVAISFLYGFLILNAARSSRDPSHVLGGLLFVSGAVVAKLTSSWIPLAFGYFLALVTRHFLGDSWRAHSTLSKSEKFRRISAVLATPFVHFNDKEIENRENYQRQLFSLVLKDRELRGILAKPSEPALPTMEDATSMKVVQNIYEMLIHAGAGQLVKEVWVPAAAIATPYTLSYILKSIPICPDTNDIKQNSMEVRKIAFDVLDWFERGNPLPA